MANQSIALQARAPQTDILGGAIQRNAQMMNMMAQQRASERQAAQAAQEMQLKQQLAVPQMAKAQSEAQSAQLKYVTDFLNTSALALSKVRNAQEAQGVAQILHQHFPDMDQAIAQTMSSIPQNPADFDAWRQRTLYDTMDAKDQLEQHFMNITSGNQTYTMATPKYAGGGMQTTEVPGTRVKAPQGITYVRGQNGEIIPMPTKTTGGEGSGLVGGPRGSADVVYGNGKFAQPAKPISQSTIGEVQDFQRNKLIPATRGKVGAGADMGTGAVGTYQITYGTLKNYAPKVLGPNWRNTPFTAEVQDQIARAIYEDNKNGDLSKVWAGLPSNKPGAYSNVPWEQAREKIAQVESGGRGGGGTSIEFGKPIEGTGKGPKSDGLTPEKKKARDVALQNLYDAVEAAHKKGHLVSGDQSYAANRAQEILRGRTWLPGGTAKKTSLDDIDTAASQLLRLFIEKGTSGTLNTKSEQDMFLRGVGGADSTYETRIKTIRNFAQQNGITLRENKAGKSASRSTAPAPVSKTIGGKTYYQINGEWYDNPEGR